MDEDLISLLETLNTEQCRDEGHKMEVYFCKEDPIQNSSFLGVCMRCGFCTELPVKTIEEVFNGI